MYLGYREVPKVGDSPTTDIVLFCRKLEVNIIHSTNSDVGDSGFEATIALKIDSVSELQW